MNSAVGKTFPGLNVVEARAAAVGRDVEILNLANNAVRSFSGCFNPTTSPVSVNFRLIGADGAAIGSFAKTLGAWDFQSFNPFDEAGLGCSGAAQVNLWLKISPNAKEGRMFEFGVANCHWREQGGIPPSRIPVSLCQRRRLQQ